jgi:hypothetical protein
MMAKPQDLEYGGHEWSEQLRSAIREAIAAEVTEHQRKGNPVYFADDAGCLCVSRLPVCDDAGRTGAPADRCRDRGSHAITGCSEGFVATSAISNARGYALSHRQTSCQKCCYANSVCSRVDPILKCKCRYRNRLGTTEMMSSLHAWDYLPNGLDRASASRIRPIAAHVDEFGITQAPWYRECTIVIAQPGERARFVQ